MTTEGQKKRVLLVDDNRDTVSVLAILLQRLGYEVHVAHDGPSAIAEARSAMPHAALLDIGLPGMSGYDVAQELRRNGQLESCVLIAMTGYGRQEDLDRSEQAGFRHHLIKPVRIDDVKQLLATL
jgi:CheY-like chemotaxis protein